MPMDKPTWVEKVAGSKAAKIEFASREGKLAVLRQQIKETLTDANKKTLREGMSFDVEYLKGQERHGKKIRGTTGDQVKAFDADEARKTKGWSDGKTAKKANDAFAIVANLAKMARAAGAGMDEADLNQLLEEELYTPLAREGLLPETFVPNECSRVQKMIDGARALYQEGAQAREDAGNEEERREDVVFEKIIDYSSKLGNLVSFASSGFGVETGEDYSFQDLAYVVSTAIVATEATAYAGKKAAQGDDWSEAGANMLTAIGNAVGKSVGKIGGMSEEGFYIGDAGTMAGSSVKVMKALMKKDFEGAMTEFGMALAAGIDVPFTDQEQVNYLDYNTAGTAIRTGCAVIAKAPKFKKAVEDGDYATVAMVFANLTAQVAYGMNNIESRIDEHTLEIHLEEEVFRAGGDEPLDNSLNDVSLAQLTSDTRKAEEFMKTMSPADQDAYRNAETAEDKAGILGYALNHRLEMQEMKAMAAAEEASEAGKTVNQQEAELRALKLHTLGVKAIETVGAALQAEVKKWLDKQEGADAVASTLKAAYKAYTPRGPISVFLEKGKPRLAAKLLGAGCSLAIANLNPFKPEKGDSDQVKASKAQASAAFHAVGVSLEKGVKTVVAEAFTGDHPEDELDAALATIASGCAKKIKSALPANASTLPLGKPETLAKMSEALKAKQDEDGLAEIEEIQQEFKEYQTLMKAGDAESRLLNLQRLQKLIAKVQRNQALLTLASALAQTSMIAVEQFFAPMKAANAGTAFIINVVRAAQQASALIKWTDSLDLAKTAVSEYGPAIQNFVDNRRRELLHHSIQGALKFVQMAGNITEFAGTGTVAQAAGLAIGTVAQGLALTEDLVMTVYKEKELADAWTATQESLRNPNNRAVALEAMAKNPTLSKYAVVYGAVVAKDPVAQQAVSNVGLTPSMLEAANDEQLSIDLCRSLLEASFMEDAQLYRTDKPKWLKTDPVLTVVSWQSLKNGARGYGLVAGGAEVDAAFAKVEFAKAEVASKKAIFQNTQKTTNDPTLAAHPHLGEAVKVALQGLFDAYTALSEALKNLPVLDGNKPHRAEDLRAVLQRLSRDAASEATKVGAEMATYIKPAPAQPAATTGQPAAATTGQPAAATTGQPAAATSPPQSPASSAAPTQSTYQTLPDDLDPKTTPLPFGTLKKDDAQKLFGKLKKGEAPGKGADCLLYSLAQLTNPKAPRDKEKLRADTDVAKDVQSWRALVGTTGAIDTNALPSLAQKLDLRIQVIHPNLSDPTSGEIQVEPLVGDGKNLVHLFYEGTGDEGHYSPLFA